MGADGHERPLQVVALQPAEFIGIEIIVRRFTSIELTALMLQPVITHVFECYRQVERVVECQRRSRSQSPKPIERVRHLQLLRQRQHPGQLDHRRHTPALEIEAISMLPVLFDDEPAEEADRRFELDAVGGELAETDQRGLVAMMSPGQRRGV